MEKPKQYFTEGETIMLVTVIVLIVVVVIIAAQPQAQQIPVLAK